MTSPAAAPRHFCGFSQTVAHKKFIVETKKLLKEEGKRKKGKQEPCLNMYRKCLTHIGVLLFARL